MAGLEIDDVRCIAVAIVQFEFVDSEVPCLLFRLYPVKP
jgi:hypothetical protein